MSANKYRLRFDRWRRSGSGGILAVPVNSSAAASDADAASAAAPPLATATPAARSSRLFSCRPFRLVASGASDAVAATADASIPASAGVVDFSGGGAALGRVAVPLPRAAPAAFLPLLGRDPCVPAPESPRFDGAGVGPLAAPGTPSGWLDGTEAAPPFDLVVGDCAAPAPEMAASVAVPAATVDAAAVAAAAPAPPARRRDARDGFFVGSDLEGEDFDAAPGAAACPAAGAAASAATTGTGGITASVIGPESGASEVGEI